MFGAMLGDMIGAPYEFDRGAKTKEFPLFSRNSEFTDDTVMTIAVAEALMDSAGRSDDEVKAALVTSMRKWGRRYPDAGYGGMFYRWLRPPCGCLPRAGCSIPWRRRGTWPGSPPR